MSESYYLHEILRLGFRPKVKILSSFDVIYTLHIRTSCSFRSFRDMYFYICRFKSNLLKLYSNERKKQL